MSLAIAPGYDLFPAVSVGHGEIVVPETCGYCVSETPWCSWGNMGFPSDIEAQTAQLDELLQGTHQNAVGTNHGNRVPARALVNTAPELYVDLIQRLTGMGYQFVEVTVNRQ